MAKAVKDKSGGFIQPKRPFVGREDLIQIFFDKVKDKIGQTPSAEGPKAAVLVYHGMAGIGKSELRKELAKNLSDRYSAAIFATVDFQDPKCRLIENALFRFRTELKARHNIRFPAFDLAYTIYWKKANPNMPLNKETFALWGEAGLATDFLAIAKDLPAVSLFPKIGEAVAKGSKIAKEWWKKRGSAEIQALLTKEAHEMLEYLPAFLAEDIRNFHQEGRPPLVLFFDTYESLWAKERHEFARFESDRWVTTLIENLPEALFVITGREPLHWKGKEYADIAPFIEHHEIVELPEDKAIDYLTGCGIEDEAVRNVILKGSKGVPVYLAISVDTFWKIKERQKREPKPEDFAGSYKEIISRFLRNLDKKEVSTIRLLSAARKWDKELFKKLIKKFDIGFDMSDFDDLHTFSFIKKSTAGQIWAIHDLIREQLQGHIKEKDNDSFIKVHKFLFKYYDKQLEDAEVKNITDIHKTAITEAFYHATCLSDVDRLYKWVTSKTTLFKDAAQWNIIVPIFEALIEIMSRSFGENDSKVATCVNNLAYLYDDIGNYKEAEMLYKRAIEIGKKTLGEDHPDLAIRYNNLALLYFNRGKYELAELLYKRAIEIDEKALDPNHPQLATHLNNLATLYDDQGKYDEAEPLYKRAIDILEKSLDEDHPDLATAYNNLATLYINQGKYELAEPLYKRAIEIDEKALGPEHPGLATDYNNLAGLYFNQGKYELTEPYYLKALAIFEKALPAGHPSIKTVLENIAIFYHEWGNEDKAREFELRWKALEDAEPDKDEQGTD